MHSPKEKTAELYKKFSRRIFEFLMKYCRNEETAMDLMQETFLNFHKSYSSQELTEQKSIMLLYTIARNQSINHSRKFSTQKETAGNFDFFSSKETSFVVKEEFKDLELKLYSCLGALTEDQRTAILLKNVQELNLEQIAEIMNVSVSTASRLVIKATSELIRIAEENEIFP